MFDMMYARTNNHRFNCTHVDGHSISIVVTPRNNLSRRHNYYYHILMFIFYAALSRMLLTADMIINISMR